MDNELALRLIAADITESLCGGPPFKVGDVVSGPDDLSPVRIVDGQYMGIHGISNYWYWRPLQEDGTLGPKCDGHGWRPKVRYKIISERIEVERET